MKSIKLLAPLMVVSLINLGVFADGSKKHKPHHKTRQECCAHKGGIYNHDTKKCTKDGKNICP